MTCPIQGQATCGYVRTGITIIEEDHLGIPLCAKSLLPPWCPLHNEYDYPISSEGAVRKWDPEKEKKGMRASWRLNRTLAALSSRLHLCPWYFERVIVRAWDEHRLNGAGVEAGLLIKLLACLTVLLRGTPNSLDGVRGCRCRIGCLSEEAALYFCREGRSMLFRTEGAVCVSIDCYDPARYWQLELEVCIVRYRIETSERSSSE